MPPQPPIIVIADDLSGAAELAGIAYHHGLTAQVLHAFSSGNDSQSPTTLANTAEIPAEVLAIDTDSRNQPALVAAARVQSVTKHFLTLKPAWIFKKVDSVLRGNVRAEIAAALEVTGHRHAVHIPANPSRGRTIQDGRYLIDGTPLQETHFADDPHFPRRSSELSSLLDSTPTAPTRIVTPDVTSSVDLARLAASCGPDTLPAGAADFFQALLAKRVSQRGTRSQDVEHATVESPALLVCGSRAAWPARVKACNLAGVPIEVVSFEESWTSRSKSSTDRNPTYSVGLIGLGSELHTDSERALRALAAWVSEAIKALAIKTILVEGGATAAAVAEEMNWSQFTVVANSTAGVGILQPIARSAPRLLIKPGSYPWPPEIWQSFCQLAAN